MTNGLVEGVVSDRRSQVSDVQERIDADLGVKPAFLTKQDGSGLIDCACMSASKDALSSVRYSDGLGHMSLVSKTFWPHNAFVAFLTQACASHLVFCTVTE